MSFGDYADWGNPMIEPVLTMSDSITITEGEELLAAAKAGVQLGGGKLILALYLALPQIRMAAALAEARQAYIEALSMAQRVADEMPVEML